MATPEDNILQVARDVGILEPKIEGYKRTDKGDNYMGELSFVRISGKNRDLDLIYKAAPKNEKLRGKAFVGEAFRNEVLLYKEMIPLMRKFQKERCVPEEFDAVARCYSASAENLEEYLIFENLNTSGYGMWNRKVPMNKAHVISVFKVYAKLHATSAALADQEPEAWGNVCCKIQNILKLFGDDEVKLMGFKSITGKIKKHFRGVFTDANLYARFVIFCDNTETIINEICNLDNKRSVLLHGDCWCNNILFKYKGPDNTKPEDTKLIDWQLIRVGPGVCDLSSFIYACGSKEIFNDLDELLEIYHETFVEHAKKLGTTDVLSLSTLKDDWIKYGKLGLIISFIILKVMISDSEEAPDLSKSAESGAEIVEAFDYESKHDAVYYSRLEDVIVHCYKRGIF